VDWDNPLKGTLETECHSVLIAVPKTQKGPRLIAKEPTCHQWAQQCVRSFLNDRINKTFLGNMIDFSNQSLSREAAQAASESGLSATIDLKSASDRLSCWAIQRFWRKNLSVLQALIATRTRYIDATVDKKLDSLIKLRKFSTQGSALTFPMQSIFFASVCLAVGKHLNPTQGWKWLSRQVRVYGDDLIVPVTWEPLVSKLLTALYLKVNTNKTHASGNFRESCGMDAWRGHDVTPAYITQEYQESNSGSLPAIVEIANNLFKKGFWHASKKLESTIPSRVRKYIPTKNRESGAFGLISHTGIQVESESRFNGDTQVWEVQSFVIRDKAAHHRHEGRSNLLQFFTEAPDFIGDNPIITGKLGLSVPVIGRKWVPIQALMSA